jgi:hypothetical protein
MKALRRREDVEIQAATTSVKGYWVAIRRDSQKKVELGG